MAKRAKKTALDLALERESLLRRALLADYQASRCGNRQFIRGVVDASDKEVTRWGHRRARHKRRAKALRERAAGIEARLAKR